MVVAGITISVVLLVFTPVTPVSVNVLLSLVSPKPNSPWLLFPVDHTLPSVYTTCACVSPAATVLTLVKPTSVSVDADVPSCPILFFPITYSLLSVFTIYVVAVPTSISITLVMPVSVNALTSLDILPPN